jgi:hypothetical protein
MFSCSATSQGSSAETECSPSQYKHVFVDESLALGKSHSRSPTIKSISPLQSSPVLYFRYVPVQSTEYSIFGAPQGDHQISSRKKVHGLLVVFLRVNEMYEVRHRDQGPGSISTMISFEDFTALLAADVVLYVRCRLAYAE